MLIDATSGHELLSFMNAYLGYNQNLMHPANQNKTSFITKRGIYCYKLMSFRLKNVGVSYQRLVNKMFSEFLEKTMEIYIDDMLMKSLCKDNHVQHLHQVFNILVSY